MNDGTHAPAGIDSERVSDWLTRNIAGFTAPATFHQISGGRSNLTFLVTDADGRRYALRRPPTSSVLESAHDMGREWKFQQAMRGTGVPVANLLAFCDDQSVTGADFYVMDYIDGHVLAEDEEAQQVSVEARRRVSEQAPDVLAALHAIDITDLDVPGSRKPTGYVQRQVERWTAQVEAVNPPETEMVRTIAGLLLNDIPPQVTGIAHGDFRIGNLAIDDAGNVLAVYDWELATTGDSLADLGWMLSSWVLPGEDLVPTTTTPTLTPGFLTREVVAERYAAASGNDISRLPFYLAFQRWRGACIQLGVRHRYQVGAMGDDTYDMELLDERIDGCLRAAREDLRND